MPYWSLDIPGLGEAEAREVLALAIKQGLTPFGDVVDPRMFLTLHLDRDSVAALAAAVARARLTASGEESVILAGLAEVFEEWLPGALWDPFGDETR